MLGALLLLGMFPLAMMGFGDGEDEDTPDTPPEEPAPEAEAGRGDLLDPGAEPAVHRGDAGDGETVVEEFRAGQDRLEIDVRGQDGEIVIETTEGEDGPRLDITAGGGDGASISFPGLAALPAEDILFVQTAEAGGDDAPLSLAEIMESGEAEALDAVDPATPADPPPAASGPGLDPADPEADTDPPGTDRGAGLDPVDPDAPEDPGPADDVPGLDPVDPDTPDDPEPGEGEPGLDPVDPDTPIDPPAAERAPGLDPVDPDLPDGGQTLTEGEVADIADFEIGRDILGVTLADSGGTQPTVQVAPSGDGADAEVRIDGVLTAILRGAAEASAADVRVVTGRV